MAAMTMKAFSGYATTIFARRHRLEEESRSLAVQRDALLPKLVSGEVRMKEAKTSAYGNNRDA